MGLIVDANVLIAAFMKKATTRELLLDEDMDLATPEYGLIETRKILSEPKTFKRLGLTCDDLAVIWSVITGPIDVIPRSEYQASMEEARRLIDDPNDVPYLARALMLRWSVWSNDPHFQTPRVKARVAVLTTAELVRELRRRQR